MIWGSEASERWGAGNEFLGLIAIITQVKSMAAPFFH